MASNSLQSSNIPHDDSAKQSSQISSNATQTASSSAVASGVKGKKAVKTTKKAPDANETGKLLAAKINQLELNAADEKDQEQEIGMCR